MGKKKLHPVHLGEVLSEEFLKPMGLSQNRLALDISVPPGRINEIVLLTDNDPGGRILNEAV
jgi:antitoxin HigA-1